MQNKRYGLMAILLLVSLLASALVAAPAQAADSVTTQMVVCLDGSGSIDDDEWTTLVEGLAEAVNNEVPTNGILELGVIQFSGGLPAWARVEVPMTVIDSPATANTVATQIADIVQGKLTTPMAAGIDLAVSLITGSPNFSTATWQIINISSDGVPNMPGASEATGKAAAIASRSAAIAAGIDEIDAEAVGFEADDMEWMRGSLVHQQPGVIVTAPDGYPPRPPNPLWRGWVRACDTFDDYAEAIGEKFLRLQELLLEPPEAENPVGTSHTVTATYVINGIPQEGVEVTFTVISGPNTGKTGTATTDVDGKASWTYTDDSATPGDNEDTIEASVDGGAVVSNSVTKTWRFPELLLEPPEDTNPMRTSHTVTATLTDTETGDPVVGATIGFDVLSGPNAGKTGSGVTDANGQATWTYTDDAAMDGEMDIIQASAGSVVSNTVTKTWKAYGLELGPESAQNCLGTSHTVTATLTDHAGNPVAGETIDFVVLSGPNAGKSGSAVTGADGKASWSYTDDMAVDGETDQIQASHATAGVKVVSKLWKECTTAVPGMTGWGMILSVMALGAMAVVMLRRKQAYQNC